MPKMPHNNRVSASVALKTNSIWTNTIGHDPYAAANENGSDAKAKEEQAAGLLLLAKMSNVGGGSSRGACGKCGMAGHLTFQCRNSVAKVETESSSDEDSSDDDDINNEMELKHAKREEDEKTRKRSSTSDRKSKSDRKQKKKKEKSSKKHKKEKKERKKIKDDDHKKKKRRRNDDVK